MKDLLHAWVRKLVSAALAFTFGCKLTIGGLLPPASGSGRTFRPLSLQITSILFPVDPLREHEQTAPWMTCLCAG